MARFLDSELLRRVRVELGLTQEQAAERLGITARSYRRYESGAVNDPRAGFVVRHANRGRVLDRICAEFGLNEEALLREPASASKWRPRRVHPLPHARHFVGRETLQRELAAWLANASPVRVTALVAIGGTGKTTLLERVLEDVEAGERGVFVWSFYEDPRVDAFVREASAYFGKSAGIEPLSEVLGAGPPHVLALDGLEVAQADGRGARARGELEDASLRRLLVSVASGLGGTRALITSRFPLVDLASWEGTAVRSLRLDDLTRSESIELLERWGVEGTKEQRERLAGRLGGHALSLAVAGSYAAAYLDGDPGALETLDLDAAAEDEPLARRLAAMIEQYARALSPAERDLMARLAAFPEGASLATIEALARAGGDLAGSLPTGSALRRIVGRLERLGLVTRGREVLLVHPFVRDRFLGRLGVAAESVHRVESGRLEEALRGQPDAARTAAADPEHADRSEALLLAALRAGLVVEAFGIYVRTLGGFPQLGLRSGDMARGARLASAFAPARDPETLDRRLPAELRAAAAYDWGLYAGALGDLSLAERCYLAFERFACEAHGEAAFAELALAARTRAYVARLRGDVRGALELIRRSVALAEENGLDEHLVRSLGLEASIRHDLGDVAGADERFARVRGLEGEPEARRALWEGEHAHALGRLDVARAIAERASEVCERLGWEGHVAHARTLLGLLALEGRAPDASAAREHLARARRWCDLSGEVEVVLRARVLAARLALVDGELATADEEATRGLRLARSSGFRLAEGRLGVLASEIALRRGDAARALALAEGVLASPAERGDAWASADAAHVAGMASRGEAARAHLARAVRERENLGHPGTGDSRAALERLAL